MQVALYKTASPMNYLNKKLAGGIEYPCQFTDGASVLAPIVKLTRNEEVAGYNYMYIPKFKRYYYINGISYEGDFMLISGTVDVLMSHKNFVNSCYVVAERSSSDFEKLIPDPMVQVTDEKFVGVYEFPNTPFKEPNNGDFDYVINVSQ